MFLNGGGHAGGIRRSLQIDFGRGGAHITLGNEGCAVVAFHTGSSEHDVSNDMFVKLEATAALGKIIELSLMLLMMMMVTFVFVVTVVSIFIVVKM